MQTVVQTPRVTARPTSTATPRATATKKPTTSWYQQTLNGTAQSVDTNTVTITEDNLATVVRDRYTQLLGNGKDTITLMVYMCGTDLESRSGMASADLQEMAQATYGDNVRIIVYTGGCKAWKINGISSTKNQIWRVANGKLSNLVSDDGSAPMTDPTTLTRFIRYASENYPASRYDLILWDHGGGSVSGYGYDEKYASSGSMSLAGINTALANANVKFDFIGFDACLMATVETAMMASRYADYMIASEESEPGIGWYYTNWISSIGKNTSLATTEIGKQICDDFTSACNRNARGQTTTLSLVDLAQLSAQVPDALSDFARSISGLIEDKEYQTVSAARNGAREFARSSRIDQVDLSDLAQKMGNNEGKKLSEAIQACVKYNRVSGVTNAYGLSIYFPYQKVSGVDKAVQTYQQIGMDDAYADCIRAFASLEASGQVATGGVTSPYGSLSGQSYSGYGASSTYSSQDLLGELLGSFLGGGSGSSGTQSFGGLGGLEFLFGRNLSQEDITSYVFENHLDGNLLYFTDIDGEAVLVLPEDQWALVQGIDQNIFVDDGAGYIDLGLDNVFSFDDNGNLVADLSCAWLSMDGQVVPYYHLDTEEAADGYRLTGYIPAMVNDIRKDVYVSYDSASETWEIIGCQTTYDNDETDTKAKLEEPPAIGDTIQCICDYYTYDGSYQDSYLFGNPIVVNDSSAVTDAYLPANVKLQITYRLTDIYNQKWWTDAIVLQQ
ncbi:MAG: peptidase C11 [Clostridia bacterium]|nr:peptidase C11 [Clostridia bacterium]